MNKNLTALHELPIGALGKVKYITAEGSSRRRMLELGLIPGTRVEMILKSPAGDPLAYRIRGAVIALRLEESSKIMVKYI